MGTLQAGTTQATNGVGNGSSSDIGELYRALSKRLERIVRVDVRAPDPVIEDACQFAWSRLLHHQSRVRYETALGWLVKTAVHEAFKLVRRAGRDVSLEAAVELGTDLGSAPPARGPDTICEQRERLAGLSSVSLRQQRLLWLYGLGLSYEEIARHEDCTQRTVERQLQQARASLRTRFDQVT
jgi:RNA polymerase sigma factor (sigma-70 family)